MTHTVISIRNANNILYTIAAFFFYRRLRLFFWGDVIDSLVAPVMYRTGSSDTCIGEKKLVAPILVSVEN